MHNTWLPCVEKRMYAYKLFTGYGLGASSTQHNI